MWKILLVDDEYPTHEAFHLMLNWNALGFELPEDAMDGEEALRMMREKKYDVLITDIRMPKMDGIALMKAVRQISANIYILVLTGYDEFSYAQQALRFSAKDFFLKPVDRHELSDAVAKIAESLRRREGDGHLMLIDGAEQDMDKLIRYLDTCFRQDISVNELGRVFHMSPAYLGQCFHKATGQTIKDYVNTNRIKWVKEQALADQMRINQIIVMAGFKNPSYFYRKFQEVEGMSFMEWRKAQSAYEEEE